MRKQKRQAIYTERNAKNQEGKFCFGHAECVTLTSKRMQLEDFLKNQSYFSLGHLPTEHLHPATRDLSAQVADDLPSAIRTVQKIDLQAIGVAGRALPLIRDLSHAIQTTFANGHRVFLSGCGATGRLALTLEALYREVFKNTAQENNVQALMAGGDFALVKSVENFEDYPNYGVRHLLDLGFKNGDLLIAITEGGETPYVLGTVEGALAHSETEPWFVYCNPRDLLVDTVPRSREVIENPRVHSLCLPVGPMALSGSTRLQAASAQMMAVGSALFQDYSAIQTFIEEYSALDLSEFLSPIILWEAKQYQEDLVVLYETNDYPIAVLTDTTERSPTFSLAPFEKSNSGVEDGAHSLCYLSIPDAADAESSWHRILNRKPVGLAWPEFDGRLDVGSILEFDFGKNAKKNREVRVKPKTQSIIKVRRAMDGIVFEAEGMHAHLKTNLVKDPLCEQLLIKILLNTLSLMVMGKIGRYEGNVMTWVRASNGKLIDRTLRYLEFLIEKRGLPKQERGVLIEKVFEIRETVGANEAVVLRLLEALG
jgi:N-acetylmuramic acid 6-phosphate etherase